VAAPPDPHDAPSTPRNEPVWTWRADWTEPVRRRPTLTAAIALLAAGVTVWRVGPGPDTPAFVYLTVVGAALAVIDVALHRLPDPLTLPSYGVGAALLGAAAPLVTDGAARFVHALLGLAVLWTLFAVQWFVVPNGIGLGDVKLSGVLGLYLGWLGYKAWVTGVLAMFVLGGLFATALLVTRRADRESGIPYGPFMLAGTLAAIVSHGA
jgi:leader peptidase (prepilin peptidase) / N-methyltransferase